MDLRFFLKRLPILIRSYFCNFFLIFFFTWVVSIWDSGFLLIKNARSELMWALLRTELDFHWRHVDQDGYSSHDDMRGVRASNSRVRQEEQDVPRMSREQLVAMHRARARGKCQCWFHSTPLQYIDPSSVPSYLHTLLLQCFIMQAIGAAA